jgi:hypothetical protein
MLMMLLIRRKMKHLLDLRVSKMLSRYIISIAYVVCVFVCLLMISVAIVYTVVVS